MSTTTTTPLTSRPYLSMLDFTLTAEQIKSETDRVIADSNAVLDSVAAAVDSPTWENTVQKLADFEGEETSRCTSLFFPMYVSTDKNIRDVSSEASVKLEAASLDALQREDVYAALKAYRDTQAPKDNLTPVQERLLSRMLRDFERNGMNLAKEKRDELLTLQKRLSELSVAFSKSLNEDETSETFTTEELGGMPDDFLSSLDKSEDGKYIVTLKYPHLFPVLRHCKVGETRKRLNFLAQTKCLDENLPLLEETVRIRQQTAELLGFKCHADYVLDVRMAKSQENVLSFLDGLKARLVPGLKSEIAHLLDMKREECEKTGEEFDGELHDHDWRYFHYMMLEREFQVDHQKIKEYFPIERVVEGTLRVYETILELRFEQVQGLKLWHEDVSAYEVLDQNTNDVLGMFFLDLHPRPGKYGHAAVWPMQKSYARTEGRQLAVAGMVCNFTKSQPDRPSLLKHDEVVTFFHEFGHVMHNICSKNPFSRFGGTSVERDFVEAPSQMLENWCFEPDSLAQISGHYERPSETLPDELRERLVAAKNANTCITNSRQLFFGLFDQRLHSPPGDKPVDVTELWHTLSKEVRGIPAAEGTNGAASFGHIMGGYDASYYGYLWSEVFSADMFRSRFRSEGVLNPKTGREYRDVILAPGGSRDSAESLKIFLGREPNDRAFLKHIGLED